MKAILIGNYGVGNFGDEALKEYFLRTFPEVEWTVVSARPKKGELSRLPSGFRSLSFRLLWWRTLLTIGRSDLVVFGGGTLFTDIESIMACLMWGSYALVAHFFGVPTYLAFQGAGPFMTRIGEVVSRWVFCSARYVSVRDEASYTRVSAWRTDVIKAFDPVILLFLQKKMERRSDGSFVLIPRYNSSEAFLQACDRVPVDARVLIALFQSERQVEQDFAHVLTRKFPQATTIAIDNVDILMNVLSTAEHCICERFHGALAAAAAGTPTTLVTRAKGDKLDEARTLFSTEADIGAVTKLAEGGEEALRTALHTLS